MRIVCATGNPGKLREFHLAGEVLGIDVEPLEGLKSIPAPEETGATFEENACIKAAYYSGFTSDLLFADDSGLAVDALGGEPGVHSARYAGGNSTNAVSDAANNALLLQRLGNNSNRTARFICVIALARAGQIVRTFRGEVEGEILEARRGSEGFGYDPLFYYPPFGCTFGEVEGPKKFDVSHRGKALRALLEYLKNAADSRISV
jgi:XTP/dITP diphosphohydrolase